MELSLATVLSGGRRQEGDAPHRPSQADGGLDVRRGEGVDEAADHVEAGGLETEGDCHARNCHGDEPFS